MSIEEYAYEDNNDISWTIYKPKTLKNTVDLSIKNNDNDNEYNMKINKSLFDNDIEILNKRIFYMIIFNNDIFTEERLKIYNDNNNGIIFKKYGNGYDYNNLQEEMYKYIVDFIKGGNNKIINKLMPPNPIVNDIYFKK